MKVSKEQAAQNRSNVVQAASKQFRLHGFGGINVADLTASAGLTHGSFYRQFESKEALFAEAISSAFAEATEIYQRHLDKPDGSNRWSQAYLAEHEKYRCPVVNLAADVSRHDQSIQQSFAEGLEGFLDLPGAERGSDEWNEHTASLAMIFGTLLMVRAVRLADKPLADAIAAAGRDKFAADSITALKERKTKSGKSARAVGRGPHAKFS